MGKQILISVLLMGLCALAPNPARAESPNDPNLQNDLNQHDTTTNPWTPQPQFPDYPGDGGEQQGPPPPQQLCTVVDSSKTTYTITGPKRATACKIAQKRCQTLSDSPATCKVY